MTKKYWISLFLGVCFCVSPAAFLADPSVADPPGTSRV